MRAHPPLRLPGPANPTPHRRPTHTERRRRLPDGRPPPDAATATPRRPAPGTGVPATCPADDPPRTQHAQLAIPRQGPRTTHRRPQPHEPAQPARHQRPACPQRSPRSACRRPARRDPRRPPRPPRQHRRPLGCLRPPRLGRPPRDQSRGTEGKRRGDGSWKMVGIAPVQQSRSAAGRSPAGSSSQALKSRPSNGTTSPRRRNAEQSRPIRITSHQRHERVLRVCLDQVRVTRPDLGVGWPHAWVLVLSGLGTR